MSNKKYTPKPIEVEEALDTWRDEDLLAVESTDVAVYEAVSPVEAFSPKPKANTYTAVEGDSYATIADKVDRGSLTKFEYAKWLYDLNGGQAITAGSEVRLG